MNINQLKYYIALANTLSFTKASKQFYISQTAITLQIKLLEEELGCTLIDRSTRPLTLTAAGNTFLIEAKNIINSLDQAIIKTKESSTNLKGILKLGYLKGYERSDLSDKLALFHKKYPEVIISTYRMDSSDLFENLKKSSLDAIIASSYNSSDSDIKTRIIDTVPLMVALYENHPLAKAASIKRADLKNERIIQMTGPINEAYYLNLYHNAGYKPNIIFSSSDYESILIMVASEQGISIMPEYCTRKLMNADNLIFIPLIGKDENEKVAFMYKDNCSNYDIVSKLSEII